MLKLVTEKVSNLNELKDFLYNTALEWDNDFSGTNGNEYLWLKAKGFESNLAYVLDKLSSGFENNEKGMNHYLTDFMYEWMDNDEFYRSYEFNLIKICDCKYVVVLVWETPDM